MISKICALIISTGLLLSSCDPCGNLDCISSDYSVKFKIVSKTDSKDLLFGPNKIYDKNKIEFFYLNGSDTTFFDCKAINDLNSPFDSVLYVDFFSETDKAYMKLSNGDIDTLDISYKTHDSACCTITEITKFRLNNLIDIPVDQGTQEIRK